MQKTNVRLDIAISFCYTCIISVFNRSVELLVELEKKYVLQLINIQILITKDKEE
jgi:hypothetical protein